MAQNWIAAVCVATALLTVSAASGAGDYSDHPAARAFVDEVVKKHDLDRNQVQAIIDSAVKKQAILDAIARPAEKTKPWHEYRQIFLGESRIEQGVAFWRDNAELLQRVANDYGVAPEVIVAILGVETRYGHYMGSYRVIDALATLGFDYPPRSAFFSSELEQFLLLVEEQQQDPLALKGSYAGAMGFGQFIPSSYRRYARDNDGDNIADIWNNKSDALASVANYFKAHGWQTGEPVVVRAERTGNLDESLVNNRQRPKLTVAELKTQGIQPREAVAGNKPAMVLEYEGEDGPQYWLGFNNFYVITRYNHSHLYALAVWQLSQAIAERRQNQTIAHPQ